MIRRWIKGRDGFYRELFALVLPIVIQNLISSAVNMADVVMLGRVDQTSLAASSLAPRTRARRFLRSAVIFLIAWFPIFLSANALVGSLHLFHYPVIDFIALVIALFSLLHS